MSIGATILGTFPNKIMRSVRNDAMLDMTRYISLGTRLGSSLERVHDSSYETTGSRYSGYGLQIAAKAFKVKAKLSKRHDKVSIRLQDVALLGSWRPLEFLWERWKTSCHVARLNSPQNY